MATANRSVKVSNRLDARVFVSLVIITLLSLAVFGFRYMQHPKCKDPKFSVEATNYYTGTPLRFSSKDIQKGDEAEWSFGTKDKKKSKGQFVSFSYSEPGQYLVGLTVNGVCRQYQFITISKAPRMINPLLVPRIICPSIAIEVGKPVIFRDSTADARSWEWRFGESEGIDATSREATYVFKTTGFKTVTLVVNGKPEAFATCQIFVNEKATQNPTGGGGDILLPPIEDKPESDPLRSGAQVTITDPEFQQILEQVVKGTKFASDFTPYLCGGNLQTPVNYKVTGSSEKVVSFELVCRDLEEMKERKIKKVTVALQRDPGTNCINGMHIKVEKKKLF